MIVCGKYEHEVSMGTAGAIFKVLLLVVLCVMKKKQKKSLVFGGLIGNYLGQSVVREIDTGLFPK